MDMLQLFTLGLAAKIIFIKRSWLHEHCFCYNVVQFVYIWFQQTSKLMNILSDLLIYLEYEDLGGF